MRSATPTICLLSLRSSERAKILRSRTMSAMALDATSISSSSCAPSELGAPVRANAFKRPICSGEAPVPLATSLPSSSFTLMAGSSKARQPSIVSCKTVSGLLISCATPATRVPSAASFSVCTTVARITSCSRRILARSSVRSRNPWIACSLPGGHANASSAPTRKASSADASSSATKPKGAPPCRPRAASMA